MYENQCNKMLAVFFFFIIIMFHHKMFEAFFRHQYLICMIPLVLEQYHRLAQSIHANYLLNIQHVTKCA